MTLWKRLARQAEKARHKYRTATSNKLRLRKEYVSAVAAEIRAWTRASKRVKA